VVAYGYTMTHHFLDRPEVLQVLFYPRREEDRGFSPPGVRLVAIQVEADIHGVVT